MDSLKKRLATLLFVSVAMMAAMLLSMHAAYAEDTTGLAFDKITIEDASTHTQVADLTAGEVPALKAGVTYALNVSYNVPSSLQFTPTYLNVWFDNGMYVTALPGSTFTEGAITSTSFSKLVKTPTGTGTSPYGYPTAGSNESRNGDLKYMTKNGLVRVDTKSEIRFRIDDAYENEDAGQIIANAIKVSLSTDATNNIDPHSFNINPADTPHYGFYVNQSTEVVSKGGTTGTIETYNSGSGASLTEANSKTTVQIVYPKDLELVNLEETALYHTNGTIVNTVVEGDNKVATVEWNEPGSYSSGLNFKPHIKVPADSTRANGSTFDVTLRNFKKTIWNDSPNADRTSGTQTATMHVTIIDGATPEKITTHALVDHAPNWALKKYDTYNTRLGAYLIKNELSSPTMPKTLEMTIDKGNTAIIRGVTIPYKEGMTYGPIHWTASDGTSGTADPSILKKPGSGSANVSALITNTALGLDINTSITSIKVDLGPIPGGYDGIRPMSDLLDTRNPADKHVYDEYYGWSYISNGVYGSWKQGTDADVKTTVKLYTTGTTPSDGDVITGKTSAPKVLNGVGTISKSQINGGDSFNISGTIDDGNWDWNPLQEPVLYTFMPEGFSYSNLSLTGGTLGTPEFVGSFDKNGTKIKVWKYPVNVGNETRGQYQPDFSIKSMRLNMTVSTNKLAEKGVYHINDFVGFTTKDFKEIGAVIKAEKWDHSNWNTEKYTETFGDKVNSGKTMVSLSEGPGVTINQAAEIAAHSTFSVKDGQSGAVTDYTYDPANPSATTAVLQKGDTATVHIAIRNNANTETNSTSLFVPLLSKSMDRGNSFTPEGATKLPLSLASVTTSSNFQVKYIKLKPGVTYNTNHAPQPGDYTEVSDPSQADMLQLVSNQPLAANGGGYVDVSYKVNEEVGSSYNDQRTVFNTTLDYDINGNHSMLTLDTNAVTFAGTDVVLTKVWDDSNNVGGIRPTTSDFAAALTLTSDKGIDLSSFSPHVVDQGNGKYIVSYLGLPKYVGDASNPITYTLSEGAIAGYTADTTSIQGTGNKVEGTITNTHTPETINIPVTKKWVGPEGSSVTVKLLADGVDSGKSVTLSSANSWSDTFTNLPKYKNGTAITYTVDESSVTGVDATKYTTAVSGSATAGFTITNTNTEKIDISGTKTWNDDGNRDGARPSSITINLLADGIQVDSKAVTADASGNWTYSFAGLAKYSATDGHQIAYTITENAVADYSTTITDYDVTNTHTPAQTSLTVTKAWSDDNDRDGVRPSSVEVVLYANGVAKGTPVTLNAANNWSYTWTGLDQKDNGTNIVYTVDEPTVPTGYTKAVTGDATSGFTITNTHTPTPPEPGPNPAPEPDPTPAPSPDPDPDPNGKEVASILPKTADEGTLFAGAAGLAILSAVGGAVAVTARRREED